MINIYLIFIYLISYLYIKSTLPFIIASTSQSPYGLLIIMVYSYSPPLINAKNIPTGTLTNPIIKAAHM